MVQIEPCAIHPSGPNPNTTVSTETKLVPVCKYFLTVSQNSGVIICVNGCGYTWSEQCALLGYLCQGRG